jgi:hypothetical protein
MTKISPISLSLFISLTLHLLKGPAIKYKILNSTDAGSRVQYAIQALCELEEDKEMCDCILAGKISYRFNLFFYLFTTYLFILIFVYSEETSSFESSYIVQPKSTKVRSTRVVHTKSITEASMARVHRGVNHTKKLIRRIRGVIAEN